MNFIKVLTKFALEVSNLIEKEVNKMTKKMIVIVIAMAVTLACTVVPAMAYTELKTPVSITATGILAGVTETFAVAAVLQSTGVGSTITFSSPSGAADSGKALKITGGTNYVNNRIIVYTDNASYFTTGHNPKVDADGKPTGADGSGMVGQSDAAYCVPLYWGVNNTTTAGSTPNDNVDYTFSTTRDASGVLTLNNATWIVDKGNSYKYVAVASALDNVVLYKTDGTAGPVNTTGDGLCPQSWTEDYWTSATVHTSDKLASMALYKSIATIAYGMSTSGTSVYTCSVANYANASAATSARIGTASADALYIFIGGDFYSKPAQTYTTTKLNLAIVQD